MHNYKKLDIWVESVDLSVLIYQLTYNFPPEEKFGIAHQLRRASISVASNIAEGASRKSTAEFKHFLAISIGSLNEIDTQIIISEKLEFINNETGKTFQELVNILQRKIFNYLKSMD